MEFYFVNFFRYRRCSRSLIWLPIRQFPGEKEMFAVAAGNQDSRQGFRAANSQKNGTTANALDLRLNEISVPPGEIHLETAPGPKSLNPALSPCGRKGGQKMQKCGVTAIGVFNGLVTLQERLRDSCRSAKVPVDLEGRMVVEKIGQGGLPQEGAKVLVNLFTIAQPGPEIDDPRAAPAGVTTAVSQAKVESRSGRIRQFWIAKAGNLIPWVKGEKMRHVPMPEISLLVVLKPFQEPSVFSDG